jgi:N-acylglucosamine-6-phosphate 2-epimerase
MTMNSGQSFTRHTLETTLPDVINRLRGGLIVSCQALPDEPLFGAAHMAAMAHAAEMGGAVGIRANNPVDIAAIRAAVRLPLIGIYKVDLPGFAVRITPTLEHAQQVAEAGAHIIALDATRRPHPDGITLTERVRRIKELTGCPVMADISNLEEGLAAEAAGADMVGTTLSGYTSLEPPPTEPDFELLRALACQVRIPLIAEGRITTPAQAVVALSLGAFAVTVGGAITRPQWITAQFTRAIQAHTTSTT